MNYNLTINRWYGRGGGHIKQLVYAIYLAEVTQSNLTYPEHSWFENQPITFNQSGCVTDTIVKSFFYGKDLMGYSPEQLDVYRIGRQYVHPLLKCKIPSIPEDCLVIHLRSGDIFLPSPHPGYVQPPLSFYQKIIKDHNYKSIKVVTDHHMNNPCIIPLKKMGAQIISGQSMDDFGTLVGATNLVLAKSNFSISASWVSAKLKNLYAHIIEGTVPIVKEQIDKIKQNGIVINQYASKNYIKLKGWKATSAQKKLMLGHNMRFITRI